MLKYRYIVIEGNIGAGKTSLAEMIAADLNGVAVLEEFAENTFLPQFYKNPDKYAFPLELSFLAARHNQLKQIFSQQNQTTVVSDYHFRKSLLFSKVNLDKTEMGLYESIYNIMASHVPEPDLVIFLESDTNGLLQNIRKRGRNFESEIDQVYLEKINESYKEFIAGYPFKQLLKFDANSMNFVANKDDYKLILKAITD
jgi:deoxyguanosine kinase